MPLIRWIKEFFFSDPEDTKVTVGLLALCVAAFMIGSLFFDPIKVLIFVVALFIGLCGYVIIVDSDEEGKKKNGGDR